MSNEIREAVQMVLTRMETHPDDFFSNDLLHTPHPPEAGACVSAQ